MRQQILRDHREIGHALQSLDTGDPVQLPGLLKELHGLLLRHYKTEEGPGGLFGVIVNRAPEMAGAVHELRGEHTELLAELLHLGHRVGKGAPLDSHLEGVRGFVQHLREHERRESRLLVRALASDP